MGELLAIKRKDFPRGPLRIEVTVVTEGSQPFCWGIAGPLRMTDVCFEGRVMSATSNQY